LPCDRSIISDAPAFSVAGVGNNHIGVPLSSPSSSPLSFAALGVRADLVKNLDRAGITAPFPIQAATLPDTLAGHDLCGRAPTGSGKTIAFGLPLLTHMRPAKPRRPRGLVIVPTRELAAQVADQLVALAPRDVKIVSIYGGVSFERQVKALRSGVEIVVATPGRLIDLMDQKLVRLDEVEVAVIDEADRLADMGFLPAVRRILDDCGEKRQTLLFSATLDGDVDVLVRNYQHKPKRHELELADDAGRAEHLFWAVERTGRVRTAAEVVRRLGPTVVFCRTKRGAERVAKSLNNEGVRSEAIHGDRSQAQRQRALQAFHDGRVQCLVATDVAARGIHVDDVAGVIHFDPPADYKDYTHRSGRTARAGNTGFVVSLVLSDVAKAVRVLQKDLSLPIGTTDVDLELLGRASAPPHQHTSNDQRGADRDGGSRSHDKPTRAKARHESRRHDTPASGTAEHSTAKHDTPASGTAEHDKARHEPSTDDSRRRHATASTRPTNEGSQRDERGRSGDSVETDEPRRRPSGAARRKAKREAARLGIDVELTELRDPYSTRPTRPARPRPGGARPKSGSSRSSASGSRGSSSSRSSASGSRGTSSGRSTSGRSTSGRSTSGRSTSNRSSKPGAATGSRKPAGSRSSAPKGQRRAG
jgi:superfamily II DNA/RNA helicase